MSWFAGIFAADRRDPAAHRTVERLATARDSRSFGNGPLAMTAPDAAVLADGPDYFCAVAGRIYGLEQLANRLGLAAHEDRRWGTVIRTGFRVLGPEALTHLRGNFALMLWDDELHSGVVAHDLSALASVYIAQTSSGGVAFATELRELLKLLQSTPAPDQMTLSRMIGSAMPLPGRTMFEGVTRLQRGLCLRLDQTKASTTEYWRPTYRGVLDVPIEEMSAMLRQRVSVAVQRAVGASPRAAVLLSGGLDSSLVASVASQLGLDVTGYSAVFEGRDELDETEYVDSVVDRWGISRYSARLTPSGGISAALDYLDAWKVPVLGCGYLIEHTLVQRIAQDGPLAVIDGQGGDELFSPSYPLVADLVRRGRLLQSFKILQANPVTASVESTRELAGIWKGAALKAAIPLPMIDARRRGRAVGTPSWLTPRASELYADAQDDWWWRRGVRGPLWWRGMTDLLLDGPVICGRADYVRQRSALAGLDGGSPLLDFDLAELILQIPPQLAFDRSLDRPFARRSFAGVLPEKVRARTDKSNLFAFYRDILAGPDLAWMRRILRDPGCAVWEFANREVLGPLLDEIPAEPDNRTSLLLGTLHTTTMVECWLRQQQSSDEFGALREAVDGASAGELAAAVVGT